MLVLRGSLTVTRPTSALALLAALALALSACTAGSGTDPERTAQSRGGSGASTDSIVLGLVAEPASLDFTQDDGAAIPQLLLNNVYEGLVKLDQDGDIVPALATTWSVSDDRLTYTFELTDQATFSNGESFTAADAVFSIERLSSDWATSVGTGVGAVIDSATAVSPTKVEVKLAAPSNSWLYKMTTRAGAMFSEKGVAHLANDPVGTGPYDVESWKRGDSITLTRRDDYWGDLPHFQKVVFRYFGDATALNNALLTGDIDVATTVQAPEALGQFTGKDNLQVIEGTTDGEVLLSFNNNQEIFKDKRIRLAIRQAIDHQALVDTCWAGKGTLVGSFVPPTDPWYEDLTGVTPYDPQEATRLVNEAGKAGATLRLRLPTLPYAESCGPVVKSYLEAVGFDVAMDSLEFPAAWLQQVYKGSDYDLSIVNHVESRDLAHVFGNPEYYTHYGTPEIQELFKLADEGSQDDQVENLKKAARLIAEDAAADVLFVASNLMVADKDITGLPKNAIGESFDVTLLGKG
ncbi:MAG: peptide ABC transporter substrate-binding protein [Actinomycetales bacterium]|nr:MAG: peptide ABC transporter substrate-binding protein [Actinomycetales bacterium]